MTQIEGTAAAFAAISRELLEHPEEPVTFERVAARAVALIPAADHASVTMRRARGRFETIAATSEQARTCDQIQYEIGDGPCLDAIVDEECYVIQDVESDPRWPEWGRRVANLGVRSMVGIQLAADSEPLGALNVYSEKPHAFDPENVDTALIFAAHAAGAVNAAHLVSGLQTAMHSRHLIGVAQGRLMERYGLSLEVSFEVLRRYSSHSNVKLREVAQMVVETGQLPAEPAAATASVDGH